MKRANMVCSQGKVVQSAGLWAEVEVERSSMCNGCREQEACGTTLEQAKRSISTVKNSLGAAEGDLVELSISEGVILWGTVVLYMIPVGFLLGFAFFALYLNNILEWGRGENTLATLAGLLGLGVSLPVVRLLSTRWSYLSRVRPEITRVIVSKENG